jgi:hypothetical protein
MIFLGAHADVARELRLFAERLTSRHVDAFVRFGDRRLSGR